jgi:hypothetical protein
MVRKQEIGRLVVATLLCVSTDFVLTPFDSNGLLSHRTRSTRSVRTECDHDAALLHEPEHGSGIPEMVAARGLLVVPAGPSASRNLAVVPPAAAPPESIASIHVVLEEGEVLQPEPIETSVSIPRSPGQSRAPPVA